MLTEAQLVQITAALAGILVAEALYLLFADGRASRRAVNRRMKIAGNTDGTDRQAVLVQLRKERGLGHGEEGEGWRGALARLVAQAGLTIGLTRLCVMAALAGIVPAIMIALVRQSVIEALAAFVVGGFLLPLLVLRSIRARRRKRFGQQLPEAIELIVRSLKAGHPVPVAISMVGRELPDPIGTEFGLVADEVTYGSDLVSALKKMQARVGQEDLPLFLTAVAIQSSTGGNLREILQSLSDVIRQRIKMRRKIHAISAEGRISAYVLTAMPILLFLAVQAIRPDYYGDIAHLPLARIGIGAAIGWLIFGNILMRRMISFRF